MIKRIARIWITLEIICVALIVLSAEAQSKQSPSKIDDKIPTIGAGLGFTPSRGPINIQSDTVEASQKDNTITFKGNVVATQEDATLYANQLVIFYNPETKKVREIVASGNVRIVQLDRRATGRKVIFYQDENKVVLDGDAVLREGDNIIRGERVTHYIGEGRSIVEGGKGGRVSTTISPSRREGDAEKK